VRWSPNRVFRKRAAGGQRCAHPAVEQAAKIEALFSVVSPLPNCARRETHVRDLFELMRWHLWLKVTKGFIDSHFTALSMPNTEKVMAAATNSNERARQERIRALESPDALRE
jgi:hypothetical protein